MKKTLSQILAWTIFVAVLTAIFFGHMDMWLRREAVPGGAGGTEWNTRILAALLVAATAGLAVLVLNARAVWTTLSSRRALAALNVLVVILLGGGITVVLNLIAARHYHAYDWTFKNLYTLSERTEHVLASLPCKVTAHVIGPAQHDLFTTVRSTLDMYSAAAGGKLEVDYVDPAQDADKLKRTLAALGVNPKDLDEPYVVIFEAAQAGAALPRVKHVLFRDVVDVDFSGGGPRGGKLKGLKAEELFTDAILTVTREKQSAVYLLTGHQELEPYAPKPDERLSSLEKALKRLSYRVETFAFDFGEGSKKADIPADCDVLAIAGPQTRFEDRELAAIAGYLDGGGRLLLLAEPVLRPRPGTRSVFFEETRIENLLKDYGLGLEPAYVFDPTSMVIDFAFRPTVDGIAANHQITKPLVGLKLLFNVAEPVKVAPILEPGTKVKTQAILETAAAAIAVKDMDALQRTGNPFAAEHRKGPITLAAVATKEVELKGVTGTAEAGGTGTGTGTGTKKGEARIVLVGDATLAADDVAGAMPTNLDFLLNAISWLAEREESIAIGAKAPEIIRLRLDEEQKSRVQLMALLELPVFFAMLGLFVYWVRRS